MTNYLKTVYFFGLFSSKSILLIFLNIILYSCFDIALLRSIIIVGVSVGLFESWSATLEQLVSERNTDVGVSGVFSQAIHIDSILTRALFLGNTHAGRAGIFFGESS